MAERTAEGEGARAVEVNRQGARACSGGGDRHRSPCVRIQVQTRSTDVQRAGADGKRVGATRLRDGGDAWSDAAGDGVRTCARTREAPKNNAVVEGDSSKVVERVCRERKCATRGPRTRTAGVCGSDISRSSHAAREGQNRTVSVSRCKRQIVVQRNRAAQRKTVISNVDHAAASTTNENWIINDAAASSVGSRNGLPVTSRVNQRCAS